MELERKTSVEPPRVSMARGSEYAKAGSRLYNSQYRVSQRLSSFRVPNTEPGKSLLRFSSRNENDPSRPYYRMESLIATPEYQPKYIVYDDADMLSHEPSYSAFKIPYEMICAKRYSDSVKAYEAQLEHEIRENIEFQRTAADACYFVRCMAYTTFWPPLHNMTEVKHTSKNFFQLTAKEKWRLQNIMDTDIT